MVLEQYELLAKEMLERKRSGKPFTFYHYMTCGTCLNFYGLQDKLAVGSVTNMYSIVEKLAGASKVIKP